MELCVQANQDPRYLDWASQIMFKYKDRNLIPDYIEKYPDKQIILQCYNEENIPKEDLDWVSFVDFETLADGNFCLAISDIEIATMCNQLDMDFYFAYPIQSYEELYNVLNLNAKYVRLGASLFFDLDNVKKLYPSIKIRIIPNVAYDDLYPRENGVTGTWIRPEDLMLYNSYVDTLEFADANREKEQALIRIYWEQRSWPGSLNTLITNLNYPAANYLIPSDFTEKRLNCRQRCYSNKNCAICYRFLNLANTELIQAYKDAKDNNELEVLDEEEEEES